MSIENKLQKLIDGKQYVIDKLNEKTGSELTITSKWEDIGDTVGDIQIGGGSSDLQRMIDQTGTMDYLFYQFKGTDLSFAKNLDTSNVTSAKCCYQNTTNLGSEVYINLPNLSGTQPLTDTFNGSGVKKVKIDKNTKLTNSTYGLFKGASNLEEISGIEEIELNGYLFSGCKNLNKLPKFTYYIPSSSYDSTNLTECFTNMKDLPELKKFNLINNGNNVGYVKKLQLSNAFSKSKISNLPIMITRGCIADGAGVFKECYSLESAYAIYPFFQGSINSSSYGTLGNCYGLKNAAILLSSNSQPQSFFYGSEYLEKAKLPIMTGANNQSFDYIFSACYNLKEADLGLIGKLNSQNTSSTFNSCYSLKKIIIRHPDEIIPIGSNAFSNCYHLTGTVNATYNPNGDKDCYIYVDDSLLDQYKSATNWAVYADQIKPLSEIEKPKNIIVMNGETNIYSQSNNVAQNRENPNKFLACIKTETYKDREQYRIAYINTEDLSVEILNENLAKNGYRIVFEENNTIYGITTTNLYKFDITNQTSLITQNFSKGISYVKLYEINGDKYLYRFTKIYKFNKQIEQFEEIYDTNLSMAMTAQFDKYIYFFNGLYGEATSNNDPNLMASDSVHRFNIETLEFEKVCELPIFMSDNYDYCNNVHHYNGNIYFFATSINCNDLRNSENHTKPKKLDTTLVYRFNLSTNRFDVMNYTLPTSVGLFYYQKYPYYHNGLFIRKENKLYCIDGKQALIIDLEEVEKSGTLREYIYNVEELKDECVQTNSIKKYKIKLDNFLDLPNVEINSSNETIAKVSNVVVQLNKVEFDLETYGVEDETTINVNISSGSYKKEYSFKVWAIENMPSINISTLGTYGFELNEDGWYNIGEYDYQKKAYVSRITINNTNSDLKLVVDCKTGGYTASSSIKGFLSKLDVQFSGGSASESSSNIKIDFYQKRTNFYPVEYENIAGGEHTIDVKYICNSSSYNYYVNNFYFKVRFIKN